MTEQQFSEIKNRLQQFRFTSLKYTDYEEIADYEILNNDHTAIIIYGYDPESKHHEYHWACNQKEVLIKHLLKKNENERITFVPADWVDFIREIGFDIFAVWNDYFTYDIAEHANFQQPEYIGLDNFTEASAVTLSCRGQSRGFTGQSEEWMRQWIENREPAAPDYASDCAVIAEIGQEMCGVVCIGIYGAAEKTTLWIREVAVKPEYQGKGIAKKLIGQAFAYGMKHGAKKAFLMADECNDNAIHLYKSMGFKAVADECQIDMAK